MAYFKRRYKGKDSLRLYKKTIKMGISCCFQQSAFNPMQF